MLLIEARGVIGRDAPLNLRDYSSVIGELREGKNYSYGKISEWLGERLGREINKGIVYRVYSEWALQRSQAEEYDEPQPPEDDEDAYERAVGELSERILNLALQEAKAMGCGGAIISNAVELVLRQLEQAEADEKAAAEADAKASAKEGQE